MLQLIWHLCLLKSKPEKVPYSIPLLVAKIVINLLILVFIISTATSAFIPALWRAVIFLLFIAGYSLTLLFYYGVPERFVQVFSGILATMSMILVPLAIPYVIIMFWLAEEPSNTIYITGLIVANILLLIASFWIYMVIARIYKHAIEGSVEQGLIFALALLGLCLLFFYMLM
jgi:hypothetical protein